MGPPGTSVHALLISDEASMGTGLFAITESINHPRRTNAPSQVLKVKQRRRSPLMRVRYPVPVRVLNSSNSFVGFAGEFARSEKEKRDEEKGTFYISISFLSRPR